MAQKAQRVTRPQDFRLSGSWRPAQGCALGPIPLPKKPLRCMYSITRCHNPTRGASSTRASRPSPTNFSRHPGDALPCHRAAPSRSPIAQPCNTARGYPVTPRCAGAEKGSSKARAPPPHIYDGLRAARACRAQASSKPAPQHPFRMRRRRTQRRRPRGAHPRAASAQLLPALRCTRAARRLSKAQRAVRRDLCIKIVESWGHGGINGRQGSAARGPSGRT